MVRQRCAELGQRHRMLFRVLARLRVASVAVLDAVVMSFDFQTVDRFEEIIVFNKFFDLFRLAQDARIGERRLDGRLVLALQLVAGDVDDLIGGHRGSPRCLNGDG